MSARTSPRTGCVISEKSMKAVFSMVLPDSQRSKDFKEISHRFCNVVFKLVLEQLVEGKKEIGKNDIARSAAKQFGAKSATLKEFKAEADKAVMPENPYVFFPYNKSTHKKFAKLYHKTLTPEAAVYLTTGVASLYAGLVDSAGKRMRVGERKVTAVHVQQALAASRDGVSKKILASL